MNTKKSGNRKKIIQNITAALCIAVLAAMIAVEAHVELQQDRLTDVRFSSGDGEILVTWELPAFNRAKGISVTVKNDRAAYTKLLPPDSRSFTFSDGTHGERFEVSVNEVYRNGTSGETISKDLLFLDYDSLPDFPVIYLTTEDGEDPPWSDAERPDEQMIGETVTDNTYVSGSMVFEWPGHETITSKTKIRVRGNTSSYGSGKKSYKLKLREAEDMLDMGGDHADREWQLLNAGRSLNNYTGEYFCEVCGMEWVAHCMLVNVMLNGDWKGLYYLSESVSRGRYRGNVGKSGYIFENDAYWWKPDTVYFRLDDQIYQFAYTFKYPEIKNAGDERVTQLKDYMTVISRLIKSKDPSVSDYIDFDTFASWVMVRDLMHSADSGGSNMYYYLENFDEDDYTANKLKMGPVWDFDAGMKRSEYFHKNLTGWSDQHYAAFIFFPYLFDMEEFRAVYAERWNEAAETLKADFNNNLETLYSGSGEAINESRILDSARWETNPIDLREEIDYDENFIEQQTEWISDQVKEW